MPAPTIEHGPDLRAVADIYRQYARGELTYEEVLQRTDDNRKPYASRLRRAWIRRLHRGLQQRSFGKQARKAG